MARYQRWQVSYDTGKIECGALLCRWWARAIHDDESKDKTYVADMKLMTASVLVESSCGMKTIIKDDLLMTIHCFRNPTYIYKDRIMIGNVGIQGKLAKCKNQYPITDRWIQTRDDDIFTIDSHSSLYRIKWSDIKQGKYDLHALIDTQVEDFYAAKDRLAILKQDGSLLVGSKSLVLHSVLPDTHAIKWTIVVRAARHWIVAGDIDGQAIVASVDYKMRFSSSIYVDLTSNGYEGKPHMHDIHMAIERDRAAVLLACERDGCCHLISVSSRGVLVMLQRLATLILDSPVYRDRSCFSVIQSVCRGQKEGDFIVAGALWMKLVSIRIK